jgi:hypothetical protein
MDYEVLKPFNTVNRRLAPGAGPGGTISDAEDFSPFTIEERVASEFIKPKSEVLAIAAPVESGIVEEPAPSLTRRSLRAPADGEK